MTLASTGEVVGSIALRIDTGSAEGTVADIGYWIGAPYWGNGYATEAGRAIIERARELGVETIILKYFDGNDASRRVSEKLGFAVAQPRGGRGMIRSSASASPSTAPSWRSPRTDGTL